MRAGTLDRRISILRPSLAQSDSGAPIETWVPIALRRSASVRPVRGDERFSGEKITAVEQIEFRIRWSQDIRDLSPNDRIVEPALDSEDPDPVITDRRQYDILAVHEIGRREGLQIIAARRVDSVAFWDEPAPEPGDPWMLDFSTPAHSGYIGQVI